MCCCSTSHVLASSEDVIFSSPHVSYRVRRGLERSHFSMLSRSDTNEKQKYAWDAWLRRRFGAGARWASRSRGGFLSPRRVRTRPHPTHLT
ncbi:hypothetical protein Y032_0569g87 [Ancylostoma ceylanicum]|uniref:Uncharacterized protein n=1 Tax=Ancylostoma ceylanicum TaxID=53326 RepID=A0A016WPB4_9BILA|nr:hypothetical protein Y032_0569g87 [Ancylostoma ceylanicum]